MKLAEVREWENHASFESECNSLEQHEEAKVGKRSERQERILNLHLLHLPSPAVSSASFSLMLSLLIPQRYFFFVGSHLLFIPKIQLHNKERQETQKSRLMLHLHSLIPHMTCFSLLPLNSFSVSCLWLLWCTSRWRLEMKTRDEGQQVLLTFCLYSTNVFASRKDFLMTCVPLYSFPFLDEMRENHDASVSSRDVRQSLLE